MLKKNLLFTKYTMGKQLKNSCNKKSKIFSRYVYMNLNIERKIFKSVFVHTKINTCSNKNECIERLSCYYLLSMIKTCVADLVLKNKNAISHFHKKQASF